jgi:hypothetical protein
MPKKKTKSQKSKVKKTPVVRRPQVSSSQGPSYDTMMIVTILLLIFVYPLGIVFMWGLMRTWPTWLKVVVSLPLLIGIFFTTVILFAVGKAIKGTDFNNVRLQQRNIERMQRQQDRMMQQDITPTPSSPYTF